VLHKRFHEVIIHLTTNQIIQIHLFDTCHLYDVIASCNYEAVRSFFVVCADDWRNCAASMPCTTSEAKKQSTTQTNCVREDVCDGCSNGKDENRLSHSTRKLQLDDAVDKSPPSPLQQKQFRHRLFYTRWQHEQLESAFFSFGHYPDQNQRKELAERLRVSDARIQVKYMLL
jgi:Homeodomain